MKLHILLLLLLKISVNAATIFSDCFCPIKDRSGIEGVLLSPNYPSETTPCQRKKCCYEITVHDGMWIRWDYLKIKMKDGKPGPSQSATHFTNHLIITFDDDAILSFRGRYTAIPGDGSHTPIPTIPYVWDSTKKTLIEADGGSGGKPKPKVSGYLSGQIPPRPSMWPTNLPWHPWSDCMCPPKKHMGIQGTLLSPNYPLFIKDCQRTKCSYEIVVPQGMWIQWEFTALRTANPETPMLRMTVIPDNHYVYTLEDTNILCFKVVYTAIDNPSVSKTTSTTKEMTSTIHQTEPTRKPLKPTTRILTTTSTPKPTTSTPKHTTSTHKPTTSTPKPTTSTPKPTTSTPKPTTSTPKPTTLTPKPTTSTPKPTTSTPKPTTSTPKPTTSTPKPTTSTPKTTTSTLKPTTSTVKPTTSTPKPTTSTPKPTTSTLKPTTSTHKPTTSTPKPTTSTPKPTTSTVKPTTSTPRPTTPTPKPTTSTPKPTTSTPKPTTSTPKPTTSTPKTTTSTLKPTTSTVKPTTSTPKPTTSTPKPTTSTPKPTTSTPKPTTSTLKPTTSTPKPTTSTPKPTTSTPKPTTKPTTSTPKPTTSTPKPTTSTGKATTSTPKPTTSTPIPTTSTTTSTTKPTTSTPKPTTSTAKPTTSTPKPTTSTPKRTTSTPKPTTSTPRLTTPTPKPTTTTPKLTTSTPKPTTSTPKPTTSTPKPTTSTPKPTTTTPKLTTSTPKPTTSTPKPTTTTTRKPTTSTPKPTTSTPKPTTSTPKPTTTTAKPTTSTPKPTTSTPKPTTSTPKPTTSTPKPATTTPKPTMSTPKPTTTTTAKPTTSTPKPTTSTPKPTTSTPKPTTSTPKPTTSTPKPTTSTPKPTTSTPKPTTSTPKPTTSTPKPTTSTPKPTTSTPKPETTTPKPTTSTPKPTTSTPKPTTSTPKPTTSAPKPTTSTPKPTTTTPKPTTSTPKPTTSTPIPTTSTLKPTTSTLKPTTSKPRTSTTKPTTSTPEQTTSTSTPKPTTPQKSSRIVIVGGIDQSFKPSYPIELYFPDDVSQNTLMSLSLQEPRSGPFGAVINDMFYLIGGLGDNNALLDLNSVLDLRTGQWSSASPMNRKRIRFAGATNGNNVILCGGKSKIQTTEIAEGIENWCDVLDADKNKWTEMEPMKEARQNHGAVVLEDKLYIMGGEHPIGQGLMPTNTVEKYDFNTKEWSFVKGMLQLRIQFGVAVLDGNIHVCGGRVRLSVGGSETAEVFLASCEVYYPAANIWKVSESMKQPRALFQMVNFNGRLLALSGYYKKKNVQNFANTFGTVEEFDPGREKGKKWKMVEELITKRILFTVVVFSRSLAARGSSSPEDVIRFYDQVWCNYYDSDMEAFAKTGYNLLDVTMKYLKQHANGNDDKILDLAGGTGTFGELMKNHGFTNLYLLDGSKEMVKVAEEKGIYKETCVEILRPNTSSKVIKPQSFDVVIGVNCFYDAHLSPEHFPTVIEMIKPGGKLIISQNDLGEQETGGQRLKEWMSKNSEKVLVQDEEFKSLYHPVGGWTIGKIYAIQV